LLSGLESAGLRNRMQPTTHLRALGSVIIHFAPALAPACGWMREARRSPQWTMGKPGDKADAACRGQPEGKACSAPHCGFAPRLRSRATRRSGRLALRRAAGFRGGKM